VRRRKVIDHSQPVGHPPGRLPERDQERLLLRGASRSFRDDDGPHAVVARSRETDVLGLSSDGPPEFSDSHPTIVETPDALDKEWVESRREMHAATLARSRSTK
jgi:hypothetical protein